MNVDDLHHTTDVIARLECGCLMHRGLPEGGPFLNIKGCIMCAAKRTLEQAEACHERALEKYKEEESGELDATDKEISDAWFEASRDHSESMGEFAVNLPTIFRKALARLRYHTADALEAPKGE